MYNTDTIIAVATPKGAGALAILRISGSRAFELFGSMIAEREKFESAKPFTVKLYTILSTNGEEVLDEVTATSYVTPRSFTGENMVEITAHGGAVIVERLISRAIEAGMRYAGRGEFTRRAFLNGKVDLKKAESIHRIIHAESVVAHKNAVKHYLGEDRRFFDATRKDLQQLLVALETEIEFSETDDIGAEELFTEKISDLLSRVKKMLHKELIKKEHLKELDKGVAVSLVGRANAGKSSMLNMVLGYDRAIINSRAGTTRDLISETKLMHDIKVRFVDTAGLNETEDEIEQEGIRRTCSAIEESEIVCWVVAADEPFPKDDLPTVQKSGQLIGVINKRDLADGDEAKAFFEEEGISFVELSALNKEGEEAFLTKVEAVVAQKFSDIDYETAIGSDREEGIIRAIINEIEEIDLNYPIEMTAESIRSLVTYFEEIYGKSSPDDILNQVFDEFCIGK